MRRLITSAIARRRLACAVVVTIVAVAPWAGRAGADDVHVELVGFLVVPPDARESMARSRTLTGRLEVPNEQGGDRLLFTVELTPTTEVRVPGGVGGDTKLVVLEGVLSADRVRALRVLDVDVTDIGGRLALPRGALELPVTSDRLVEVRLDGAETLPVTFLLTPRATTGLRRLTHDQRVTLTVVNGTRMIVGIDMMGGLEGPPKVPGRPGAPEGSAGRPSGTGRR